MVDLHCGTPSTTLEHHIAVDGSAPQNILAIIEAFVKLSAGLPDVDKALRHDAEVAQCPNECKKKTVGPPIFRRGSFELTFDPAQGKWHCTLGVTGEIDILCEPEDDQDGGVVQG